MFGGNSKKPQGNDLAIPQGSNVRADEIIETSIGSSVSMQGVLKAEGNIRIDGLFEGEIETAGNVIVGRTGKVAANIIARNVLVAGGVKGNIVAHERLEIISSGRVLGDIQMSTLYIEEGGKHHGQTKMVGEDESEQFLLEGPR
ncbi:MAG TPA: polymer-forming cytoskeletal protein [Chloroflexia bacterium]|nr:polymer-forming cytoskeletal protein [Chloroflexia bacterium]